MYSVEYPRVTCHLSTGELIAKPAELQKAVQLSGGSPTAIANLARAYVASGNRSKAVKFLNDLKKRSSPIASYSAEIAVIYVALGHKDQAMLWLKKGYDERFNPASCSVPASILSARIRALQPSCNASASLTKAQKSNLE